MTNKPIANNNAKMSPSSIMIMSGLLLAVTMCSSAGAVFTVLTTIEKVPPFLAAFWRLFVQDIFQLVPFLCTLTEIRRRDVEYKLVSDWKNGEHGSLALTVQNDDGGVDNSVGGRLLRRERGEDYLDNETETQPHLSMMIPKYTSSLPLMLLSGLFLGLHFSMWVYSLRHTSLTHSLLFVSMSPIFLNTGGWALFFLQQFTFFPIIYATIRSLFSIDDQDENGTNSTHDRYSTKTFTFHRPSIFETCGATIGLMGAMVTLMDVRDGNNHDKNHTCNPPTFRGDFAALVSAASICLYLIIGRNLRSWVPIWLYIYPVVAMAALTCLLFAFLDGLVGNYDDNNSIAWTGLNAPNSVFGFLSPKYIAYVIYLGVGPGICGHTMINGLLKYISPIVVSTAMLMEPIIGSIIGNILGLQPLPGFCTLLGGFILITGLILVIAGENHITNLSDFWNAFHLSHAPENVIQDKKETKSSLNTSKDSLLHDPDESKNSYGSVIS